MILGWGKSIEIMLGGISKLVQGLQTHSVNEMILRGWKSAKVMILEALN